MTKRKVVSRSSYVDPSKKGKRASAGTKRVYQGTIEAQWTCSSCGTSGIPGSHKTCPNCGNPKGGDEVYQPGQAGKYLTPDQLKAMGVDPKQHLSDEQCDYCGAHLKPGTQKCPNCGAPLGDVGYTTRLCPACNTQSNDEKCPSCGTPTEPKIIAHHSTPADEKPSTPIETRYVSDVAQPKRKLNRTTIIAIVAAVGVLLMMCCLGMWLMRPQDRIATVSGAEWERSIRMEEYRNVQSGDWSIPDDAELLYTSEEVHHYDQVYTGDEEECHWEQECDSYSVYDHTEQICYDDGTCDEEDVYRTERECEDVQVCEMVAQYDQVPVYDTYYHYSQWKWVEVDPIRSSGTDRSLVWPETTTRSDTLREKDYGRSEICTVDFTTNKGEYTSTVPCDEFWQYTEGSQWKLTTKGKTIVEIMPAP